MTKKKVVKFFLENRRELFQDFCLKIYFPKIFAPPIFVTKNFCPPIFMTSLRPWLSANTNERIATKAGNDRQERLQGQRTERRLRQPADHYLIRHSIVARPLQYSSTTNAVKSLEPNLHRPDAPTLTTSFSDEGTDSAAKIR